MIKKLTSALAAGLLAGSSAGAVTTITFADFTVKPVSLLNVMYTNTGAANGGARLQTILPPPSSRVQSFTPGASNALFSSDFGEDVPVKFLLDATSNGKATPIAVGSTIFTQSFNGTFSLKRTTNGQNLLSGTFTNAVLTGQRGANSLTFNGNSTAGSMVTFTSSLPFRFANPNDFSMSITGLDRSLSVGSNGAFYSTSTLRNANLGRGTATGSFSSAVPEPGTWAMMLLGFGLVGAAMRRRRPAVATVTA